jgi:hypothetical protein
MEMKHPRCRRHGADGPHVLHRLDRAPRVIPCEGLVPAGISRTRLTRSSEWPWGAPERRSPRPRRRAAARHGSVTRRHLAQRSSRLFGRAAP